VEWWWTMATAGWGMARVVTHEYTIMFWEAEVRQWIMFNPPGKGSDRFSFDEKSSNWRMI
jgi:hypothetical protein